MLSALTLLLTCQLTGEILVRLTGLPVPGPVAGMLILLAGLLIRRRVPESVETAAGGILRYLSLLFVPSGVGIIVNLDLLTEQWAPILGAVIVGTLTTIGFTGWLLQKIHPSSPDSPP